MPQTPSNYLKEMSWAAFTERKNETDLAIIPVGAIEPYGHHLPMGSDTLVASRLAERVAARTGAVIGPVLEAGDSAMLDEFPGTITISPESFKGYLNDVMNSLLKWGFKDFLFLNGHAGNVGIISQIAYSLRERTGIRKAQIDIWRFMQTVDQDVLQSGALAHSHAGEAGTSVMLALYPELVHMELARSVQRKSPDAFPEIMKYGKLSDNSEWGTMGNSTLATAEKGHHLVDHAVDRMVRFLHEEWGIRDNAQLAALSEES
ncbi:creatininase family protein [Paenibacillus sp. FSL R7-0297]|uniref:creatininase family protein n=1 Tax=unclassified Paenibacillus TaxID=185978 RepID=UPI000693AFF3|nr:creatininase family protein [Paenibacillus sp. FSL R5-0912]